VRCGRAWTSSLSFSTALSATAAASVAACPCGGGPCGTTTGRSFAFGARRRLRADRPTVFLGSRGVTNFELVLKARDGGHHAGNWGGLPRNPGTVLANAIASMVDTRGGIRVQGLRPPPIPAAVRAVLADIQVGGGPGDPEVDTAWGEAGLTPAERVFGWNALEVLAYGCGNPAQPVNAIPPVAPATLQLRFVVGTDAHRSRDHVQQHLQDHGFVGITVSQPELMHATGLDPEKAWVRLAMDSLQASTCVKPALLPNLGGSLPNDVFADILGLPRVWVPHSYPACSQQAPTEHVLPGLMRQRLGMTAALPWQVGAQAASQPRRAATRAARRGRARPVRPRAGQRPTGCAGRRPPAPER
jgi:hypothetical protein